jgi:hypothetical protein
MKLTIPVKQFEGNGELTGIRNATKGNQFGKQDTKRPHIRLDGKLGVAGGFGSSPLDREPRTGSSLVLILLREPKLGKQPHRRSRIEPTYTQTGRELVHTRIHDEFITYFSFCPIHVRSREQSRMMEVFESTTTFDYGYENVRLCQYAQSPTL